MKKEALVIFTKNPEAGKVKTRLAATIGNDAALAVYKELLWRTIAATQYLPVDKFVYYSNHAEQEDVWNTNQYYKEVQQGSDLGERMKNAFASIFSKGYTKAVIIGTDCPALNENIVQGAFGKLADVDVVVGPAYDGGYYLLGMKRCYHLLFENMNWSTANVLPETISRCKNEGLLFQLLQTLHDVDEEKDLGALNLVTP
ncbi:TIGR04282 family arsenosugar biosynthesis glycosyltransferase [Flavisolibacter nicotianae]|uniref:TIGR04282 family arsenosugar biosynthesis glycosyltransferase n=1 Tax=Flavisolibacter nicotianae TaxID=2364882 RepID=UPI000EAFC769|nr:TIGR04282 family arsenosugar biosynthesis glycosyltransferase [Flavisolibacter nicotianae]